MNEKVLSVLEKLKAEAKYYKQFKDDNRAGSEYLTGKGAGGLNRQSKKLRKY